MANLTNEKAEFAIAIFRHFSPLFAIFRHWPPPVRLCFRQYDGNADQCIELADAIRRCMNKEFKNQNSKKVSCFNLFTCFPSTGNKPENSKYEHRRVGKISYSPYHLQAVAKHYFVQPPLIANCRPYLEPDRFARQNLSVEMPFHLAQI